EVSAAVSKTKRQGSPSASDLQGPIRYLVAEYSDGSGMFGGLIGSALQTPGIGVVPENVLEIVFAE
ncbi:hypothetical protein LTR94_026256, partial [Friedmanniomyces endolithicus]